MTVDDPYDLERFVRAQDLAATYAGAVGELRRGRKMGHWMWFVFPQIAGLGRSATSRYYSISSLEEARAYLAHPILGSRLVGCSTILVAGEVTSASEMFGELDAQKLHSSMTLFSRAAPDEPVFRQVLDRYFAGLADPATEARL